MRCNRAWTLALWLGPLAISVNPAMAQVTPSYQGIEHAISEIQSSWQGASSDDVRRAEGWAAYTATVRQALQDFANADTHDGRQAALDRLSQLTGSLQVSTWPPAVRLRSEIERWAAPRRVLVGASRQLGSALNALPPVADPDLQANRERWSRLDTRLSAALRSYESSAGAAGRAEALAEIRDVLQALDTAGPRPVWGPAYALQQALSGLFNHPNVEAVADLSAVTPFLSQQIVQPEILYYKGQTSYITPGPKTGFALVPNDRGLSFFNSQIAYSVTPVRGFQEQVAQDDRGRFLTRLYRLAATIYNTSEARVTVTVEPRPGGIDIDPRPENNIDAAIDARNQPGHHPHVARTAISLVGFNADRIEREIYRNGIGQIRQEAAVSAREVADYKSGQAEAQLNAQAAAYLVGDRTIAAGPVVLREVDLRSQPTHVSARGVLQYRGASGQLGADFARPAEFQRPEPGLTADVHLPSALSNLAIGYFGTREIQEVENLLLEVRPNIPDAPPTEAVRVQRNVDFPAYLDAIRRAQELNDPGAQAIRVFRPNRAPEFASDRDGNLVLVIRDLNVEVPAPPAAARGGLAGPPARVYRISSPLATVALSFEVRPGGPGQPIHVSGSIASIDLGPNAEVFAINEDESDARRLNRLTTGIVLGVLRNQIAGQSFEQNLGPYDLQGFAIRSVSPLHPTGWLRANLVRAE